MRKGYFCSTDDARRNRVDAYFRSFYLKHNRAPKWREIREDTNAPSEYTIRKVYGKPTRGGNYASAGMTLTDITAAVMGKPITKQEVGVVDHKESVDAYFRNYLTKHRRLPTWSAIKNDRDAPSWDAVTSVYGTWSESSGRYILGEKTFTDVLGEMLGLPTVDECVAAYLDGRDLVHFRTSDVQGGVGLYTTAQYGQWLSKLVSGGEHIHGYDIVCRSGGGSKKPKLYTATLVDDDAVIDAQAVLGRIHGLNLVNSSASPESALRQLLAKAGDSLTFCASDLVDSDSRKHSKASRYGRYLSRKVGDVVDGYLLSSTTIHNNRVYTATKIQPWHEAATYLKPGEVTTECTQ